MTRNKLFTISFAALLLTATHALAQTQPAVDPLVGTWVVKVPAPTDVDTFFAIHTFHQGGTFTENSSLLPTLTEGPAQGSWRKEGDSYRLSFILFAYEDGLPVGFIRVRCNLKMSGADHLEATTEVDFIDPEGHVELGIGSGPFFASRQKVDAADTIADIPLGLSQSGENKARASVNSARPGQGKKVPGWSRFLSARRR